MKRGAFSFSSSDPDPRNRNGHEPSVFQVLRVHWLQLDGNRGMTDKSQPGQRSFEFQQRSATPEAASARPPLKRGQIDTSFPSHSPERVAEKLEHALKLREILKPPRPQRAHPLDEHASFIWALLRLPRGSYEAVSLVLKSEHGLLVSRRSIHHYTLTRNPRLAQSRAKVANVRSDE